MKRSSVAMSVRLCAIASLTVWIMGAGDGVRAADCTGPDEAGYQCREIPADFRDIRAFGDDVGVDCDDCVSDPIDLPFEFIFYGTAYESVHVSSNGFLTFQDNEDSGCCRGQLLPDDASPNATIAGSWTDLCPSCDPDASVVSGAVDDAFVVQFTNVPQCCAPGSAPVSMQYKLFEDGSIELHFLRLGAFSDLSIGIENEDGTDGQLYFFGTEDLPERSAVGFARGEQTQIEVSYPADGSSPASYSSTTGRNGGAGYTGYVWQFTPSEAILVTTFQAPPGDTLNYETAIFNPGDEVSCAYLIDNQTDEVVASDCDPGGESDLLQAILDRRNG